MGGLAAALVAVLVALVAAGDPAAPHLLAEVLTCQAASPAGSQQLAVTLDDSQLFWFDFPGSRWNSGNSGIPFPPRLEDSREILQEAKLCREVLREVGRLRGVLPELRAPLSVSLFPLLPPTLGEPNSLLCLAENIFPPDVEISWLRSALPEPSGTFRSPFIPRADLTFQRFSRIPIVPKLGEVYGCEVRSSGENRSVVAFWVPPDTTLDEQLDKALAGAALALGLILGMFGIVLLLLAWRDRARG